MRLIDADALDRAFTMLRFNDDKTLKHWGDRQDWCMSGQEVEDLINSATTIEPERKTGEWSGPFCSVCGVSKFNFVKILHVDDGPCGTWKFCPNCGADMRGEQDE